MLSFLYYICTNRIGFGNPVFCGIRYKSLFRLIVRSITQVLMPIVYRINQRALDVESIAKEKRGKRIIVSMT